MENIKTSVYMMIGAAIISACMLYISIIISIKTKNKKFVYLFSVLTAVCIMVSGYFSLDLTFKDYVRETGIYYHSRRVNYYYRYFFDTGEDKYQGYKVYSEKQLNGLILEEGKLYEYVYAKRTKVLIQIEEATAQE